MKRIITYHLIPVFIAILFLLAFLDYFGYLLITPPKADKSYTLPTYFSDYRDGYSSEQFVYKSLSGGYPLVVMGSSEMADSTYPAIPYNFFKCIGIGHAGNQCFSIYSQLCAMSPSLQHAKIVIIVSPGWFCAGWGNGTSPDLFLEYDNGNFLYSAYFNKDLSASFKDYIGDYIIRNYNYIDSPSSIINLFYYNSLSKKDTSDKIKYGLLKDFYYYCCKYKITQLSKLTGENKANFLTRFSIPDNDNTYNRQLFPNNIKTPNWDSLETKASNQFKAASSNNNMAVTNAFYSKHLKIPHLEHLRLVKVAENKELKDFDMLLRLLHYYNTDAYFVIEPLNPFGYNNLKGLTPIMDTIKNELALYHFSYYNMFVTDSTHYKKGTLCDLMHFNNLGWYMADSAIYNHFKLN